MKKQKIVEYILAFLLSLLIWLFLFALSLRFGIFNQKLLVEQMNRTDYYEQLSKEINLSLQDMLQQAELPVEMADDLIDERQIYIDGVQYINNAIKGNDKGIDTSALTEHYYSVIKAYFAEQNVPDNDEIQRSVDEFVAMAVNDYEVRVEMRFAEQMLHYQNQTLKWIQMALIIAVVLGTAVAIVLYRSHSRRHIGMRYIAYALFGASILQTLSNYYIINALRFATESGITTAYQKLLEGYFSSSGERGYYLAILSFIGFLTVVAYIPYMKGQRNRKKIMRK